MKIASTSTNDVDIGLHLPLSGKSSKLLLTVIYGE